MSHVKKVLRGPIFWKVMRDSADFQNFNQNQPLNESWNESSTNKKKRSVGKNSLITISKQCLE